jgi:hypothetical protein
LYSPHSIHALRGFLLARFCFCFCFVFFKGMTWIKQIAPPEAFHVAMGGPPLALNAAVLEQADKFRCAFSSFL